MGPARPARRLELLLLASLVLGSAALRLYRLDRESLWQDEVTQTRLYREPLGQLLVKSFSITRQTPLDYLIGWAVFRISSSDFAVRLPAAAFGTAGVLALYLLLRRLFSIWIALLGALLLALSPLHLELSQEARPYTIFLCFYTLSLYVLTVAWQRNDWKAWLLFCLVAELMLLSRAFGPVIVYLSMAASALLAGLANLRQNMAWPRALSTPLVRFTLCSLLLGLLYLPVVITLAHYERSKPYTTLWSKAPSRLGLSAEFGDTLARNTRLWYRAMARVAGPAAGLKLALTAIGLALAASRWRSLSTTQRLVLASLPLASLLYLLAYTSLVPAVLPKSRYFLFQAVMSCTFAAVAAVWIIEAITARLAVPLKLGRLALLAVVLLLLSSGGRAYANFVQTYRRPDWRACAQFLDQRLTANDAILVFTDRRFGRFQRGFAGQLYLRNKPLVCDSLWRLVFAKPYAKTFIEALMHQPPGRVYLVLHFRLDGRWRQRDFLQAGLQKPPPGMQLRKFRRLDLLWFAGPPVGLVSETMQITGALLGTTGQPLIRKAPSSRAMVHALRAKILAQLGYLNRAAREYQTARAAVPQDQLGYFDAKTGAIRLFLQRRLGRHFIGLPK